MDLAATDRSLKQSIARRKTAEKALEKSAADSARLLKESRNLQKHLQHLIRKILSAQEDERKKISRDLQDEIAQTLLGINLRLVTLKKMNALSARGRKKEFASAQRVVDKSFRSIDRFVRELPS